MTSTHIICLGNPLMRDEGIGIRLATELQTALAGRQGIEVLDMGTGGLSVLHQLARCEHVIFVDCAFMEEEAGAIKRFHPEEAVSQKVRTRQSPHEGDLFATLELSRNMGECPDDIVIIGIQPKVIENGEGLSPELEEKIDDYLWVILEELPE